MTDFLTEATERGFIHQCTDLSGLAAAMTSAPISAYVGFDCTADSLHVGSLVQIMLLRLLQRHGHKPVVLVGGGTTLIGDPSGKDESRKMLSRVQINDNMVGIKRCLTAFLYDGPQKKCMMVNNLDWLSGVNYLDLLRDVGPHFTINRMLNFDSVKLRLDREQPMTFLEFNYMILQSYDFRELNRRHGVVLQMGGSDQWGNIVSGIDLVRRTESKTVYGLTTPLMQTASGAKMGKSESGAVWLTNDLTPVFDYWQFWRNTEDADVGRFLRLFTDLPLDEIARLEKLSGAEINEAKKILATEATAIAHGRVAADSAAQAAHKTFESKEATDDLPLVLIEWSELEPSGIEVCKLFVLAGLTTSKTAARRLIEQDGAKLDNALLNSSQIHISAARLLAGVKLSAGKKLHRLVKLN